MRFATACMLVLILGGASSAFADTMAKIDHSYPTPPPVYPDAAQDRGEQGDVLVEVQVADNGRPRKLRLKQSSGFDDLDMAAFTSAASWHYLPAFVDGDFSTTWMTVKIHYALPSPADVAPAAPAVDEHEIKDNCTRPVMPSPVDGKSATSAEMVSAKQGVDAFLKASDRYQTCLRLYVGGQENLAFSVHSTVPKWIYSGIDAKVAANQKDKQAVGDSYNAAAAAYKARPRS
jgi:TonB family protein